MPSEVVLDTTLVQVAPVSGKGALGKWRAPNRKHRLDADPGSGDNLHGCRAGGITLHPGVYASERLSLAVQGKALQGKPLLPTGLGKSDRPG